MPTSAAVPACGLLCQFGNLNPAVQGAAMASAAALIGTVVTVVITALQLWHRRSESKREREFQLKKDVLLGLLDGMNGMRSGINMLLNINSPFHEAQNKFNQSTLLASRAHGTASVPIIKSFMVFIEKAQFVFLHLLVDRIALDRAMGELNEGTERVKKLGAAIKEQSENAKLAPSATDELLQKWRSGLDRITDELNKEQSALNANSALIDKMIVELGSNTKKAQLDIYPFSQAVTALVREDLGIDALGQSNDYIQASSVTRQYVEDRIKEFIPDPPKE